MSSSPSRASRRKATIVAAAIVAAAVGLALGLAPLILPYRDQAALDRLAFSRVFLDAEGKELQVLPLAEGLYRVFVPLSRIPPDLVDIVVKAEDRRFWWHPGFDPIGVLRASWQNLSARRTVSGASTISMQLARLLHRGGAGSEGKMHEAWDAMQLERRLGKRGVLELYLNLVPFGHDLEGYPAAARGFFGKPLAELSRSEILILAVIPRSPGLYGPYPDPRANGAAVARLRLARVGADKLDAAYSRLLDPSRPGVWPFRAPHYIRWLASRPEASGDRGRSSIRTAIEGPLQSYLEAMLAQTVEEARPKRVSNAAAIFLRPDDMRIAAWVGSIDFEDDKASGQVDGVTMTRQPGSTLKPFLYSLAIERGATAATILPDIPTDFGGNEVYTPANFNDQFNGPVRLRQALASSLNVPAVYTLQRMGVASFTDRLISLGFSSLESQRGSLGLGLALGNAEVSLFELVQAYGVFLHDGSFMPITPLPRSISPAGGPARGRHVVAPSASQLVRDILVRHPDRVLAFGRDATSRLQFESAMKTGTSNQFNNIWAIGFTPDLLGGVWLGNFGGQTVVGTADSGYPASVMRRILEAFSEHPAFPPMTGFSKVRICALSGMRATDSCPHTILEYFLPGTEPAPCDWHSGGGSSGITRFPQEYQSWLARYRYRQAGTFEDSDLAITRPLDGSVFYLDPSLPKAQQQLAIEATGSGRAELSVDGATIYRGFFPLKVLYPLSPGEHRIELSDGSELAKSEYQVR